MIPVDKNDLRSMSVEDMLLEYVPRFEDAPQHLREFWRAEYLAWAGSVSKIVFDVDRSKYGRLYVRKGQLPHKTVDPELAMLLGMRPWTKEILMPYMERHRKQREQ